MALRYSDCMTARQTLPLLWLLSDLRNDAGLERALANLPRGSGFVFRHYHLSGSQRRGRFDTLADVARSHGHTVVLAGNEAGSGEWSADGFYGAQRSDRPGLWLATAHDADEIRAAEEGRADGVFLSPVFPTASHPGAPTLGVDAFRKLATRTSVPVIALGGMTHDRAAQLQWPRWGAIDGLASANAA
ncbi:thiamine phosphate synthase [Qipengyuania sp. NPDC077563]|uniref:thiamine phosphate synthase n=1 Tax=Qipengyuania sp. NPDC077563 TaxID=3364497 RepID=UPI00384BFC04